jgi:hypothetical protein
VGSRTTTCGSMRSDWPGGTCGVLGNPGDTKPSVKRLACQGPFDRIRLINDHRPRRMGGMVVADQDTLLHLVGQAVRELGGSASYMEIIRKVQEQRPQSPENSLRANIILLTVNHPSRVHYPQNQKPRRSQDSRYDVLYTTGHGEVELYDPDKHGLWEIRQEGGATVVADPQGNLVRTSTAAGSVGRGVPDLSHGFVQIPLLRFDRNAPRRSQAGRNDGTMRLDRLRR